MPTAMAIGRAAGTAAAMMIARYAGAGELAIDELRGRLLRNKAFLGEP